MASYNISLTQWKSAKNTRKQLAIADNCMDKICATDISVDIMQNPDMNYHEAAQARTDRAKESYDKVIIAMGAVDCKKGVLLAEWLRI